MRRGTRSAPVRHVLGRLALPRCLALLTSLALAACSGPILANPPLDRAGPASPTPVPSRPADPVALAFPRDDGPHDRLTEWWYDTGHLAATDGRRFGFEVVFFRAERGALPVSWASHVALTDESGGTFRYAQRSAFGAAVDRSPRTDGLPAGFDLLLGAGPTGPTGTASPYWRMVGGGGRDRIEIALSPAEATTADGGFGLALDLVADRPPVLHDDDGWVDFGPGGGSYYASRPRLAASGTLVVDGSPVTVTGSAWFDHQWGDFISVGGGWDWYAVNLDDGTDLTLSVVRGFDGATVFSYGTLVRPDGGVARLPASAFTVTATGTWQSAATGAAYPAGWRVELPGERLVITLDPTVTGQELDTRATTGVVYWEGSQRVAATRDGSPLGGQAYVELTGYAPAGS